MGFGVITPRGVETGLATPSRARAVSAEENGMQLREAAVF